MTDEVLSPSLLDEELKIDVTLRPRSLDEYIGQNNVKENLKVFIEAALKRNEALDHVLFYGPPGLGKTTLANIISNELSANLKSTSGPVIERPGDLAAILTNLEEGDVLFIDELHRLSSCVEEVLYPAMEEYKLDLIIGQGPSARSVKIDIPRFTLIGATTRAGLLTSPLRDRFGVISHLDFYPPSDLKTIVLRSAQLLNIHIESEGALEIAERSRGTPRIANRILRRVRDYAEVRADGIITKEVAEIALKMLEIDKKGFDKMDRKILLVIIDKYDGGPVGVEAMAAAVNEEKDTLEEVYEPYLIKEGFIKRTSRGRVATSIAYEHLGRKLDPGKQGSLF